MTLVLTEGPTESVSPKKLGLSVTEAPKIFGNLSVLETLRDGLVAVVLAAGSGTRFRSNIPKVLYPLNGKPLVRHVTDAVHTTGSPVVVIVGHESDRVRQALADTDSVFVEQDERVSFSAYSFLARCEDVLELVETSNSGMEEFFLPDRLSKPSFISLVLGA